MTLTFKERMLVDLETLQHFFEKPGEMISASEQITLLTAGSKVLFTLMLIFGSVKPEKQEEALIEAYRVFMEAYREDFLKLTGRIAKGSDAKN